MLIIACVKQVPDTSDVKVDSATGTLVREGVPAVMNPFDQFALEEGVRLRDAAGEGAEIVALSMGPPQARSALMKALALGADRAILLTDRAFAGADTWATSYTLARAVGALGKIDLIMCGLQAVDGDTAQTGPEMAQHLRLPQVTYAERVTLDGKTLTVKRQTDTGYEIVEVRMPALLTCTPPADFVPSTPPFSAIIKAKKKPYEEWGAEKINTDADKLGLKGSPTQVKRVFSPPKRGQGVMLEGNSAAAVAGELFQVLAKGGVL
ncbi:MAG: electron transfer flavoprotein subunit beta/FixA family protein [Chitinispirillaceae bacterium]|nr:electron transfer flavoprotein subunit beta/FixA family protein [Chitinispirillaceae bacterium]